MIDEQSNSSFIDPRAVRILHLEGSEHEYTLTTMTDFKTTQKGMIVEGMQVKGLSESVAYDLPPLYSKSVPGSKEHVASPAIVKTHKHIAGLSNNFLEVDPCVDIMLLIGSDGGELMRTECFGSTYPFAHHTPLGWALVGSSCVRDAKPKAEAVVYCTNLEHLSARKKFYSVVNSELSGNCFLTKNNDELLGASQEDRAFTQLMTESIHINEAGYLTMPLPFKDRKIVLPNNKSAVFCRTRSTLERLKREKATLEAVSYTHLTLPTNREV